jgi:hypothetical protein
MGLGVLQMVSQRRIRNAGCHQGHNSDDAPGLYVNGIIVPYLSEEYVIIEMSKLRGEFTQLFMSCCLNNFLFFHDKSSFSRLSSGNDVFADMLTVLSSLSWLL